MQSHDLLLSNCQFNDSNSTRLRCKFYQDYFGLVVDAYREFRTYQPLVAIQHDELVRAPKLTPQIIEFLCDVEIATHCVLDGADLYQKWETIVREEEVSNSDAARIAIMCGRIYAARNLHPRAYFQHIRKGRERKAAA